MNYSENQLDVLCNFLANFHDWPIEDLESEFFEYISENGIKLTKDQANTILSYFLAIPPSTRFHRLFDHKSCIQKVLKNNLH